MNRYVLILTDRNLPPHDKFSGANWFTQPGGKTPPGARVMSMHSHKNAQLLILDVEAPDDATAATAAYSYYCNEDTGKIPANVEFPLLLVAMYRVEPINVNGEVLRAQIISDAKIAATNTVEATERALLAQLKAKYEPAASTAAPEPKEN